MAFTTVVNNMDWADIAFLNEITLAVSQRMGLWGESFAPYPVAAGEDVQSAGSSDLIRKCQDEILDMVDLVGEFWIENTLDDFNGETVVTPIDTEAKLLALADMTSGFRRVTGDLPDDWEDYDDANYSYGSFQTGDIIGPWIWADMQALLNQLTRTYVADSEPLEDKPNDCYRGEGVNETTWALSKTEADDDWGLYWNASYEDFMRYTWGYYHGGAYYDCLKIVGMRHILWKKYLGSFDVERVCKAYLIPTAPTGYDTNTWDDNGSKRDDGTDDTIVKDVLNVMLIETHDNVTTTHASPYVGFESDGLVDDQQDLDTEPTWCDDITPTSGSESLGWMHTGDVLTTYDWNFDDQV